MFMFVNTFLVLRGRIESVDCVPNHPRLDRLLQFCRMREKHEIRRYCESLVAESEGGSK